MKHLLVPNHPSLTLPFFLAAEEVATRHTREECFFTWVVAPTVIFGHNQVMENEVNVRFCSEHGIRLVRRKSGGGCVYADEGNIMMSYITPTNGNSLEEIFQRYLQLIAGSLSKLDELNELGVRISGHNDIMLANHKISGNALYLTPNRQHAIVHGTLLHSTNIERMVSAITPSAEKLAKNGVQSVRQRVRNLSEVTNISVKDLQQHLIRTLCTGELPFTPAMKEEAALLASEYETITTT